MPDSLLTKPAASLSPNLCGNNCSWSPCDTLEMENAGEHITLRPVRGTGPLAKEHGVWVFRTGNPLPASTTDELLQRIREERDLANLGAGVGADASKGK